MKDCRKEALKSALKVSHEFNSKISLEDLLETHSWVLMQEGADPYAGSRAGNKIIAVYEVTQVYGGPEEGGWYYWEKHLDAIFPFSRKDLTEIEIECHEACQREKYFFYDVMVEYGEGGGHETKKRPIYE